MTGFAALTDAGQIPPALPLQESLRDPSFPQVSLLQLFVGSDYPGGWQAFDTPLCAC